MSSDNITKETCKTPEMPKDMAIVFDIGTVANTVTVYTS